MCRTFCCTSLFILCQYFSFMYLENFIPCQKELYRFGPDSVRRYLELTRRSNPAHRCLHRRSVNSAQEIAYWQVLISFTTLLFKIKITTGRKIHGKTDWTKRSRRDSWDQSCIFGCCAYQACTLPQLRCKSISIIGRFFGHPLLQFLKKYLPFPSSSIKSAPYCRPSRNALRSYALHRRQKRLKTAFVIIQRKIAEKPFQFFEAVADLRWIGFMGFGIGLVKLIQDGFTAAVTTVKWVCSEPCGTVSKILRVQTVL